MKNSNKMTDSGALVNKIDFFDKITLSPLEKYQRYKKFPWKFLIHILLLVFTTMGVFEVINMRTRNSRQLNTAFQDLFIGQNSYDTNQMQINSLQEFQKQLLRLQNQLRNLNDYFFLDFDIQNSTFEYEVIYLYIKDSQQYEFIIDIYQNYTEPFNPNDLISIKNFLQQVSSFNFKAMGIQAQVFTNGIANDSICSIWDLNFQYSFKEQGIMQVQFDSYTHFCKNQIVEEQQIQLGWFSPFPYYMIILLSTLSLILSVKYIYKIALDYLKYLDMYDKATHAYAHYQVKSADKTNTQYQQDSLILLEEKKQEYDLLDKINEGKTGSNRANDLLEFKKAWEDFSIIDKMRFFDLWLIYGIFCNLIQIFGSFLGILFLYTNYQDNLIFNQKELIIGLGCMGAWVQMLKYLVFSPQINMMTLTMVKSAQSMIYFFSSILPLFIAYVALATSVFWNQFKFADVIMSATSLFSMTLGDIVHETFCDISQTGVLGELIIFSFMMIFYTAVQNVFVTIIMEGYYSAQDQTWKNKVLKQENQLEYLLNTKNLKEQQQQQITESKTQLSPQQSLSRSQKLTLQMTTIQPKVSNQNQIKQKTPSQSATLKLKIESQNQLSIVDGGYNSDIDEEVIESGKKQKLEEKGGIVKSANISNFHFLQQLEKMEFDSAVNTPKKGASRKIEQKDKDEEQQRSRSLTSPNYRKAQTMGTAFYKEPIKFQQPNFGQIQKQQQVGLPLRRQSVVIRQSNKHYEDPGKFILQSSIMSHIQIKLNKDYQNVLEHIQGLKQIPVIIAEQKLNRLDKQKLIQIYNDSIDNVLGNLVYQIDS